VTKDKRRKTILKGTTGGLSENTLLDAALTELSEVLSEIALNRHESTVNCSSDGENPVKVDDGTKENQPNTGRKSSKDPEEECHSEVADYGA